MSLESLVIWLLIGLIAGWLAGVVMKGGGYGLIGDSVVGILGALIGGFIFSKLGVVAGGFLGTIVVAFSGAVLLIALLRIITGRRAV